MNALIHRLTAGLPPGRIAFTFMLGALGGAAGLVLGLPLAVLLGSLVTVALLASAGVRVAVPQSWRFALVPVIGVAIGGGFTEEVAAQAVLWWVTLAGLVLYIPLAHLLAYAIYRRLGGLSVTTAYWAAMPGGLLESLAMGEKAGADVAMLTLLQFLRLNFCIILIPIGFSIATGQAVGSGGGAALPGSDVPIGPVDAVLLIAAAVLGVILGQFARLPAAIISGPVLASALIHAAGLTKAVPPDWTIVVTQWVVGTSLGTRFAGFGRTQLRRGLGISLLNTALSLTLAAGFAAVLAPHVAEPAAAVFLAYAPGGISEMSLVAVSLQLSAVYVTAHHIARIVLSVLCAKAFARLAE
ncbi:MAG: AbrB family transcriptional regulator [Gemmobacter sp.]